MYLSKSFVGIMSGIMLVLVVTCATEQARCVSRARELLRDAVPVVPASVVVADSAATGPVDNGNSALRARPAAFDSIASAGGPLGCLRESRVVG